MGGNAASCLKLGLRDEIDSVKETKIVLSFSILDYETADLRRGGPNPANRQDFPCLGRSFAPTNGTRRPAGREQEISQQSEQVIPRTDIPSPQHVPSRTCPRQAPSLRGRARTPRSPSASQKRTHRATNRATPPDLHRCMTTPLAARLLLGVLSPSSDGRCRA